MKINSEFRSAHRYIKSGFYDLAFDLAIQLMAIAANDDMTFVEDPALRYNGWAKVTQGLFPDFQLRDVATHPTARKVLSHNRSCVYLGDWPE